MTPEHPPAPGRPSRGVSQAEVTQAADLLLLEGVRPTIEKIRVRLGRGSPNTVSPMLDHWFATVGKRMEGHGFGAQSASAGLPPPVAQLARELWEAALAQADSAQRQTFESQRHELELTTRALQAREMELAANERQFEATRAQLDAALQNALRTIDALREQVDEAKSQQERDAVELASSRTRLEQAFTQERRLKEQHEAALHEKDQVARAAQERHVANERRILGELDRERQALRTAIAEASREQKLRVKAEETVLSLNITVNSTQRDCDQLKGQLAAHVNEIAQVRRELSQQSAQASELLALERAGHRETRAMLANALVLRQPAPPKAKRKSAAPAISAHTPQAGEPSAQP